MQEDLKYFEAKEDDVVAYEAEEFYAGGGQFSRTGGQEHFPQLWCRNGTYSLNGQVQPSCYDTAKKLDRCQPRRAPTHCPVSQSAGDVEQDLTEQSPTWGARMLQLFFTPLSQALRLVMHLGEPLPEDKLQEVQFNYGTLFLFFLLPYLLMMWTNGVGASTGMFVPALAVGATGGTTLPSPSCSTI